MYLINSLSLQSLQSKFIQSDRWRFAPQDLVGPKDGVNYVFTTPGGEKFLQNLPYFAIQVFLNGQLLRLLDDYVVIESGGFGTGYDTVVLAVAPRPREKVMAVYVTVPG